MLVRAVPARVAATLPTGRVIRGREDPEAIFNGVVAAFDQRCGHKGLRENIGMRIVYSVGC